MNIKKSFKKILIVLILVFMGLTATGCDFIGVPSSSNPSSPVVPYPNPGSGSNNTPKPSEPKDNFPKIPVHKQTKQMTEEELLGSNFFSSKKNYFDIGGDTRYVDLKKQKTVYIRYEQNLDSEVKKELDVAIEYLKNLLKIDPSIKLVYDKGTPIAIADLFVYDTIYIRTPDKKILNEFSSTNAAGLTYRSNMNSPVIYINKQVFKVIIDGKNILMARALLHEIMHGFGFYHTDSTNDLLAALQIPLQQTGSGKYYYFESGTRNKIYVNDYFFFSNTELAGLLEYLAPNKSFAEKLAVYKNLGGTFPDLDTKFDEMKSNFLKATLSQSVSQKSPDKLSADQIVSMIDKTGKYEIIINKDSIGTYTAKLSDGTRFTGKSKIMTVSESKLTSQIICLTDFKFNGQTRDIVIYAIRKQDGEFYQRWKVYDEDINLVFADNTANYFA